MDLPIGKRLLRRFHLHCLQYNLLSMYIYIYQSIMSMRRAMDSSPEDRLQMRLGQALALYNDHSHSSPSLISLLRLTARARHDRSHLFTTLAVCRLLLLGLHLHV